MSKVEAVERMKKYIEDYYFSNISSEDIARVVCYSATYAERIFKEITGMSRREYLEKCRFNKVEELVKTTKLPSHEIAAAVGYSSSGSLRSRFHMKYGMGMRKYRLEYSQC